MLVIVAGPVYVDLYTDETWPPAPAFHSVLAPRPRHRGRWHRHVGGSAWQFAQCWAQANPNDEVVLVTRLPKEKAGIGPHLWGDSSFVDDAAWLRAEIESKKESNLRADPPPGGTTCDYTFHVRHPTQKLWPIFTITGGCGEAIDWDDVMSAWPENERALASSPKPPLVFLTGVTRTGIPETFFDATRSGDDSKHRPTKALLDRAKLYVDLGRTDLREVLHYPEQTLPGKATDPRTILDLARLVEKRPGCLKQIKDKRAQELTERIVGLWHLIQRSHVAMVDETTAEALRLRSTIRIPRETLIVRPQGVLPGPWYRFCKVEEKNEKGQGKAYVEWREFPAERKYPNRHGIRPRITCRIAGTLLDPEAKLEDEGGPNRYCDIWLPLTLDDITTSDELKRVLEEVREGLADPHTNRLLICGETGTGKEVVARWLHRTHPYRSKQEYRAVSAGRLTGALVDSELFGHVKGAFTGATQLRSGKLVDADGGVLLVDDIDALPAGTQARLLRVLEGHAFTSVGSDTPRKVDVLVIATCNKDPFRLVEEERLREDLYWRLLSGGCVEIPPLRERPEDAVRAAKAMWRNLNAASTWGHARPFPSCLEKALRKSPLRGNFRAVQAATLHLHRCLMPAEDAKCDHMKDLPREVKRFLSVEPHSGGPRNGGTCVELIPELKKRIEAFVRSWQPNGGVKKLRRRDIEEALEIPRGNRYHNLVRDVLKAEGFRPRRWDWSRPGDEEEAGQIV